MQQNTGLGEDGREHQKETWAVGKPTQLQRRGRGGIRTQQRRMEGNGLQTEATLHNMQQYEWPFVLEYH